MTFADLCNKKKVLTTKEVLGKALHGALDTHEVFQSLDDNALYSVEFKDTGEDFVINIELVYEAKTKVEPPKLEGKVI